MSYIVYKLTSPSGKVYIGMSGKSVKQRLASHTRDRLRMIRKGRHLPRFYSAWDKYPINTWIVETVYSGLTREQAGEHERQLIALLEATNPTKGYNMAEGGTGGNTGCNHEAFKRQQHSEFIKRLNQDPEFVTNRIRKGLETIQQNPEQFKVNAEKRKMCLRKSSAHQNHTGLWVVRGTAYGSLREAVQAEGVSESTIMNFCNNPDRVAGCTNKYLTKGTTPRDHGFYRIPKES